MGIGMNKTTSKNKGKKGSIKIGDKYTTNKGFVVEVKEYVDCCNILVSFIQFDNITRWVTGSNLRRGKCDHPLVPSVLGVGYVGYGEVANKSKSYTTWWHMLKRVYAPATKRNSINYKNCTVHESWLNYQNFKNWFEDQYRESCYQIDKDLLFKGNKIYSPSNCVLVPKEINCFLVNRHNYRGEYPVGVTKGVGNNFVAREGNKYLGSFSTPEEAFYCYKNRKEAEAKKLANKWREKIPKSAYLALLNYEVSIDD